MESMAGRPTLYKEEYAEMLVQHMKDGYSFESFAGKIGVCEQTLFNWAEANPQFLESKRAGFAASRYTWEKIGKDLAKDGEGNATAFVFNMKNRFPNEWRDKREVEQKVDVKAAIQIIPDAGNDPITD